MITCRGLIQNLCIRGMVSALTLRRGRIVVLPEPPGEDSVTSMTKPHTHASHPALIARLKRADGHLRAVIEMIEAGKPCLEIAQQLQAVEKAVINAKRALIHDHLDHCLDVDHSAEDRADLKIIARYL